MIEQYAKKTFNKSKIDSTRLYLKINWIYKRCKYAFANHRIAANYLKSVGTRKLQVGSGTNFLAGWLNTDIYPSNNIIFLDATKKFPFNDCTFDYIFNEQFIEHLEYLDAVRFVQECYRVLKFGGKLRIFTPDLKFFIELYNENKTELQKECIMRVAATEECFRSLGHTAGSDALGRAHPDRYALDTFIINNIFKLNDLRGLWGHKFIYDYKVLEQLLLSCKFIDVKRCAVGESSDSNLQGLDLHGCALKPQDFHRFESMAVEARK
jgi:SAM-dependent methyltransferase